MAVVIVLFVAFLVWKFVFEGGAKSLAEEKQYVKPHKRTVKGYYRKASRKNKKRR